MGAAHFLTKGLERVATEMSLHVLAYNFRRLIAVLGISGMLAAIRAYARFLQRFSLLWRLRLIGRPELSGRGQGGPTALPGTPQLTETLL